MSTKIYLATGGNVIVRESLSDLEPQVLEGSNPILRVTSQRGAPLWIVAGQIVSFLHQNEEPVSFRPETDAGSVDSVAVLSEATDADFWRAYHRLNDATPEPERGEEADERVAVLWMAAGHREEAISVSTGGFVELLESQLLRDHAELGPADPKEWGTLGTAYTQALKERYGHGTEVLASVLP